MHMHLSWGPQHHSYGGGLKELAPRWPPTAALAINSLACVSSASSGVDAGGAAGQLKHNLACCATSGQAGAAGSLAQQPNILVTAGGSLRSPPRTVITLLPASLGKATRAGTSSWQDKQQLDAVFVPEFIEM